MEVQRHTTVLYSTKDIAVKQMKNIQDYYCGILKFVDIIEIKVFGGNNLYRVIYDLEGI